jgi:hypothetical protein
MTAASRVGQTSAPAGTGALGRSKRGIGRKSRVVAPERGTRRWPYALTVLAVPVLVAQAATLIVYRSDPQLRHLAGPALGQLAGSWQSRSCC